MWAPLALYQVLWTAITDAVETIPGTNPDRVSCQIAFESAQTLVTGARNVITRIGDLTDDIGRAVLASLHGPRRPHVCVRKVKSPLGRWNKHPPGNPRVCQRSPRSPPRSVRNIRWRRHAVAILDNHQ